MWGRGLLAVCLGAVCGLFGCCFRFVWSLFAFCLVPVCCLLVGFRGRRTPAGARSLLSVRCPPFVAPRSWPPVRGPPFVALRALPPVRGPPFVAPRSWPTVRVPPFVALPLHHPHHSPPHRLQHRLVPVSSSQIIVASRWAASLVVSIVCKLFGSCVVFSSPWLSRLSFTFFHPHHPLPSSSTLYSPASTFSCFQRYCCSGLFFRGASCRTSNVARRREAAEGRLIFAAKPLKAVLIFAESQLKAALIFAEKQLKAALLFAEKQLKDALIFAEKQLKPAVILFGMEACCLSFINLVLIELGGSPRTPAEVVLSTEQDRLRKALIRRTQAVGAVTEAQQQQAVALQRFARSERREAARSRIHAARGCSPERARESTGAAAAQATEHASPPPPAPDRARTPPANTAVEASTQTPYVSCKWCDALMYRNRLRPPGDPLPAGPRGYRGHSPVEPWRALD